MLQLIREKVTGWVAVTIVGLLIIPFAFWGVNSYLDQGSMVNAAVVNGTDIGLQEYQRAYQNIRQQWQENTGSSVAAEQEDLLKQRSLDGLIQRELLNQLTTSAGMRVGASQLRSVIRNLSYFQGANGFDNDIYERALAQTGMSPVGFEEEMRLDLISSQLQSALTGTEFITGVEAEFIARMINQDRTFSYLVVSSNYFKDSLEVTDEEVKQFYESRGEQFYDPEQVRIAYINLSLSDIAAEVKLTEENLLAYYETNKAVYDLEEQRKFKQIFISTGVDATAENLDQARSRALELRQQIESGTTFAELSESITDDAEQEFEASEHDYMIRGIMPEEVDAVMFELAEGDTSQPIETDDGIYLIQVDKIMGGIANTLENVRDQVELDYSTEQAETRYFELADQLANLVYENPDTLEIAADDLELPIHESTFFSREQPADGILGEPDIITASFSEEVMLGGNNSEPIELEDNRVVVLRVEERIPEKKKPLEEVHPQIVTRIKYERASDMTRKQGEDIISLLKEGTPVDEIAARYELEWQEASAVRRDDTSIDITILRTVFRMGRPVQDQPLISGTELVSGDYAVIRVTQVSDPATDTLNETEVSAIQNQLQRLVATNLWIQFIDALESEADIQIYSNNL